MSPTEPKKNCIYFLLKYNARTTNLLVYSFQDDEKKIGIARKKEEGS